MTEKLPYWKHPQYDPSEDPASGFSQWEMLAPITTDLPYAVISECICSVQPDKHDPDFLDYKLGEDSIEKFPSVCSTKNYSEPGYLIFSVVEEDISQRLSISIRKVGDCLYLMSYSWQSTEPPFDSGEDAAWEGGNVNFKFRDFTEAERIELEGRLKDEAQENFERDSMYGFIPVRPPCRDSILIKSDASMLSESLNNFLDLRFTQLCKLLLGSRVNGALPDHIKFGEWLEFSIQKDLDPDFYRSLENLFAEKDQKKYSDEAIN